MCTYCCIASRQIASTATVATAIEYDAATAKIIRIIWGHDVKATMSPTVALLLFVRRSIEQFS